MKKTERIDIRLTPEEKALLEHQAQEHGMNLSEYTRHSITKCFTQKTHEWQVENSLTENHIINSLLLNSELSNKSKQIIGKEIGKYV